MAAINLRSMLKLCCVTVLLVTTSHPLSLQAEETGAGVTLQEPVDRPAAEVQGTEGLAAYYAKRYNNRRTNSGSRHDPNKLTAAHATLPHGTKVKVINLDNDREVIVTINDRCRARKQPFIDLSRAAAKQLAFLGKGTARVRIIPLDEDQD